MQSACTENNSKDINDAPAMSKNEKKRILKAAKWEATKQEFREKQRQKRKVRNIKKKEIEREARESGADADRESTPGFKQLKKEEFLEGTKENCALLIDCNWENLHNDRALKSLSQQLMFSYGLNRRARKPSHVYITGVGDKLQEKMVKNHCDNWLGITISKEEFSFPSNNTVVPLTSSNSVSISSAGLSSRPPTCDKVPVYLTSESDNTLEALDPNHVYIIGGIVDRNAHKGIAFDKANALGLRTAKLPIKEHFPHILTVLTINHVVEILLKFNETQSWEQAIGSIIPERKKQFNDHVITALQNIESAEAQAAASADPNATPMGRQSVSIPSRRKCMQRKRPRPDSEAASSSEDTFSSSTTSSVGSDAAAEGKNYVSPSNASQ